MKLSACLDDVVGLFLLPAAFQAAGTWLQVSDWGGLSYLCAAALFLRVPWQVWLSCFAVPLAGALTFEPSLKSSLVSTATIIASVVTFSAIGLSDASARELSDALVLKKNHQEEWAQDSLRLAVLLYSGYLLTACVTAGAWLLSPVIRGVLAGTSLFLVLLFASVLSTVFLGGNGGGNGGGNDGGHNSRSVVSTAKTTVCLTLRGTRVVFGTVIDTLLLVGVNG
jgi:hypothetical protein